MRKALFISVGLVLCTSGVPGVAAKDGKTMAVDDWHTLAIHGAGGGAGGAVYLQVNAGDLDGDGLPDDAVVKLTCADGKVQQAQIRRDPPAPPDASSGQASGRQQAPVQEWRAATPQLAAVKPRYDVKELRGARAINDGWQTLSLANTDGLCDAAARAAGTIIKSKSNISNNRTERG
jgi:hypothetical protein